MKISFLQYIISDNMTRAVSPIIFRFIENMMAASILAGLHIYDSSNSTAFSNFIENMFWLELYENISAEKRLLNDG